MLRYILGRILQALISIVVIASIVFFLSRLTGDPTTLLLSMESTQEDYDRLRHSLGLDQPVYVQYGIFMSDIAQGDFGKSIYMKRPVMEIIGARFPATIQLGVVAITWSVILGVLLGAYAAVKRKSRFDYFARLVAAFGQSMPSFWLGLMLILVFGVYAGVLPAGGKAGPESVILPAVTLGMFLLAGMTRMTRSSMLEVLDSEYIKLARIKGVSERTVIWKHAFRNALLPILTFAAVWFVAILAGSVAVETVFAWPGIGQLVIQSVVWRDFPLTQAIVIIFAAMYIVMNLLTDILYAYINPRIRYGGPKAG